MPSSLLAHGRTVAGAGVTPVDNKKSSDGGGLTGHLIQFREVRVNSVN
jgi:hypothetical protein